MAGKSLLIFLLFATCLSLSLAAGCYPTFATRPDCTDDEVEGWVGWQNMHYKYFPKKLSWHDADEFCKPWDEEVCLGENQPNTFRYRAYLASFVADWENKEIGKAVDQACLRSGDLFWIGVKSISSRVMYYTDNTRSSNFHTFSDRIPYSLASGSCVAMSASTGAMSIRPCSQKLGFVCKIQPNKH